MSETEDRLYGLLEVAERQQAAAQAALEGMAAERAALKRERAEWAAEAKALGLSLRTEVRSAVTDGLADAATEGVQAVQTATAPLLGRLEGVAATAGQAEAALRRVVLWASWRLLGWVAAVGAATVLAQSPHRLENGQLAERMANTLQNSVAMKFPWATA